MSKKKFTEGLESVFLESGDNAFQDDSPLFTYEARSAVDADVSNIGHASSFVEEEEEDDIAATSEKDTNTTETEDSTKAPSKPLSGIDLLIRNTTDQSQYAAHPKANQRKISLVFDKLLLKKLKLVARMENTYFRELISALLHNYVERYEREKGPFFDQSSKKEDK